MNVGLLGNVLIEGTEPTRKWSKYKHKHKRIMKQTGLKFTLWSSTLDYKAAKVSWEDDLPSVV